MITPACLPRYILIRLRSQSNRLQVTGFKGGKCVKSQLANLAHMSSCSEASSPDDPSVNGSLAELQAKIELLAGQTINVNSPKQVSSAIFGHLRSVNRDVLQQAADGQFQLTSTQQQLAALVLQHRLLSRGPIATAKDPKSRSASRTFRSPKRSVGTPQIDDGLRTSNWQFNDVPIPMADQYEGQVERLFESGSKIHQYWKEPLMELSRPTARALVAQLDPKGCPMGFDPLASPFKEMLQGSCHVESPEPPTTTSAGKKGSFLAYCRDEKEKYPDAIVLTRCGDFYETYGVDAIMMVEHCGLNSMAGKAKAGCPIRNVQATLDCLTARGFRVAVYEEGADTDSSTGPGASASSKSRIKNRFLAQIVSPASPTYLYDLVLLGNADTLFSAAPSRPYVGVLSLSSGYTMVEVSIEERTARVSERLTAEAVACRLAAYPPADPLIYVPSMQEQKLSSGTYSLPFLPSPDRANPGHRLRIRAVPPTLVEQPRQGLSEIVRAKNAVLSVLVKLTEVQNDDDASNHRKASIDSFSLVSSLDQQMSNVTHTQPLYLETATQLGLMEHRGIPSLVSYLLPASAPAATRRFLRRYLLTPPPPVVAAAMGNLIRQLTTSGAAVPPLSVPPIGKMLSLLRAGQASAQVFLELLQATKSTVQLLDTFGTESVVVQSLMTLLEYETGMAAEPQSLRRRCMEAAEVIESVVATQTATDVISCFGSVVPPGFFERNEGPWRRRIRREAAIASYADVERKATVLAERVATDYWGFSSLAVAIQEANEVKSPIAQDVFNNAFALRDVPRWVSDSSKSKYEHPRDRFGKVIRNRYATECVQEALSDYVAACNRGRECVSIALTGISQRLHDDGHIPAIVQAAHTNLLLSTTLLHAGHAKAFGWNQPDVFEGNDEDTAGHFEEIWPYWMDRSTAVANSFALKGIWLLTAPNMAGKSTVIRSTAAAALLGICGLCAPLGPGSRIRRFDYLFVRGASADVPTENKSAFGAEMGDVAALLRCCGEKSLVFVDELGRGTSPRDGTRLAAAVLEEMAQSGMSGMFASHLHDILSLPLEASARIYKKQIAIHERDNAGNELSRYSWTYRIQDGVCTDSMALLTASRFGLPEKVLARAQYFGSFLSGAALLSSDGTDLPILETNNAFDDLESVQKMAESITGSSALSIPPSWSAPPSLDGESCVYVLQLKEPVRYYVGETDNIRQRLEQHRAKGGAWASVDAVAVPVEGGKSEARAFESLMIRHLAQSGFPLESTADGRPTRSGRAS